MSSISDQDLSEISNLFWMKKRHENVKKEENIHIRGLPKAEDFENLASALHIRGLLKAEDFENSASASVIRT